MVSLHLSQRVSGGARGDPAAPLQPNRGGSARSGQQSARRRQSHDGRHGLTRLTRGASSPQPRHGKGYPHPAKGPWVHFQGESCFKAIQCPPGVQACFVRRLA